MASSDQAVAPASIGAHFMPNSRPAGAMYGRPIVQVWSLGAPPQAHQWHLHSVRIITATWAPDRVAMAADVCATLNRVLPGTPIAPDATHVCTTMPAVYGANYTEGNLQGLVETRVLAEPSRLRGHDTMLDRVRLLCLPLSDCAACTATTP